MNKQEWKDELEHTRRNRQGIGMYIMDTFDDETAQILEEYSKAIRVKVIDEFVEKLNNFLHIEDISYYKEDIQKIAEIVKERQYNDNEIEFDEER